MAGIDVVEPAVKFQSLLNQIGHACATMYDRELLLERVVRLIAQAIGSKRVFIALDQQRTWQFVAWSNGCVDDLTAWLPQNLSLDSNTVYGLVYRTKQSVYIADLHSTALIHYALPDTVQQLIVPFGHAEHPCGLIDVQTNYATPALKAIQSILEIIGQQLAIALSNARLKGIARYRQHYTDLLATIRQRVLFQQDISVLYRTIVDVVGNELPVRSAILYIPAIHGFQPTCAFGDPESLHHAEAGFNPIIQADSAQQTTSCTSASLANLTEDIALNSNSELLAILRITPFLPFHDYQQTLLKEFGTRLGNTIERHHLYRSMYATNERNALFARIVTLIRQTLNVREVIYEVTRTLATWLKCDYCTVAVQEQHELRFLGTYRTFSMPDHQTAVEALLHHHLPHALEQQYRLDSFDQQHSEFQRGLRTLNIQAFMSVPMQVEMKWVGFICAYKLERDNSDYLWNLDQRQLMNDIADQLALVFRQLYLYEAEQQRRRELEALQDIIHAISGQLDLKQLCSSVVLKVTDVFDLPVAAVLMWTADAHMEVVAMHGLLPQYAKHLAMNRDQVEYWLKRYPLPQPLYIPDVRHVPILGGSIAITEGLASLYAQPLIVNGKFNGWLQMYTKGRLRQWTEAEAQLITAIAQQIAQAIHTVQRYTQERMLRTDAEQSYHDLRQVMQELEHAREHVITSEKLRALGQLSSGVAHDFNNLLASILGNTQLLLLEEPDQSRRETLALIERAARDGAVTVRRIQEYARSAETVYDDVVDLADVASGGIEFTRPWWWDKANQQGAMIEFVTHLQHIHVRGSAAELREICVNLISNAVDALVKGGTITVSTGINGQFAYLSIADNGVGVLAENRLRMFDPFFTTKAIGEGTGMGLAVALSIAQRHGGTINFDEVRPHGSKFTLHLPHYQDPAPRPLRSVAIKQDLQPLHILVVDDDSAVRSVLKRVLSQDQHDVTVAASGEEALRYLDTKPFEMLITDLGMPGMNGWDVIAQARQRRPTIHTMLITGWGYHPEADNATMRGADVVMTKPFDMYELRNIVAQLAQKSQP